MRSNSWIFAVTAILLGVVVLLYAGPKITTETDFTFLPRIYASINFITAVVLLLAFVAIRQKKINRHRKLMITALILSVLFLTLYVIYHSTSESTKFGGEGMIKTFYYSLLLSHILLSAIIVPLVLYTFSRAVKGDFERHKKWAKFTWPIWFYVALSGVAVYLMISPYY